MTQLFPSHISLTRLNRWVHASHCLAKYEPYMVPTVQGLGRLDCSLHALDAEYVAGEGYISEQRGLMDFTDHLTLSYLWVLGSYELVRVIDEKERGSQSSASLEVTPLLRRFARLRMPLAKFEAEKRHRETDSHIAYPALNFEFGVAWQVADGTFISRGELSEDFLHLLEGFRLRAAG